MKLLRVQSDGHRGGEVKEHTESSSCKHWVDRIEVGIHKEAAFRIQQVPAGATLVLREIEREILV